MSQPFLAEVSIFGFNFAPRGWAFCDGQLLPINQNQSLYSLLGSTYGGDGSTTFALPDMRGRTPIHVGSSNGEDHRQGQKSGEETHVLTAAEMTEHDHVAVGVNAPANNLDPTGRLPAETSGLYATTAATRRVTLTRAILNAGGGLSHENMQPFLVLNYCIALQGLFPARN